MAASERQIAANQINGAKGHGPKTAPGLARSSQNARKTGMYSKLLVLPGEPAQEFNRLQTALREEWRPVGITEVAHVDRLAGLFWKRRRLYNAEANAYAMLRPCREGVGGVATALLKDAPTELLDRLQAMDVAIERSISLTVRSLQQLQKDRALRPGLICPSRPPADPEPPCPEI